MKIEKQCLYTTKIHVTDLGLKAFKIDAHFKSGLHTLNKLKVSIYRFFHQKKRNKYPTTRLLNSLLTDIFLTNLKETKNKPLQ